MSDERPRLTRVELPSDRDQLLRMLDETTRFLNTALPLHAAWLKSRRMSQDPVVQAEVSLASHDLEPILNGRSPWAAVGDIEGRYPAFDGLTGAVRRVVHLTDDLTTQYLPLTGGSIEVSGFPTDSRDWIADLRAGGKLFDSFVAVVREAHDAIVAKLAAAPVDHAAAAPPVAPGRPRRGRPADTDPRADNRIAEAWQSGRHATHDGLAAALGTTKTAIRQALDRHRKRAGKNPT